MEHTVSSRVLERLPGSLRASVRSIDEIGLAVKVPGARLQPRQQEWRTQMVREGAVFVVVHSLDEFVQALNSYLGNTQPVSMDTPAPAAESDNWADSVARAGEAQDEICDEGFEYGAWGYDYSSATAAAPANAAPAQPGSSLETAISL